MAGKKLTTAQKLTIVPLLVMLYLLIWIDNRWEQVLHVAGDYLIFASVAGTLPILFVFYRSIRRDVQRKKADYNPVLTFMVFLAGTPMMIFSCGYILVILLNLVMPPQTQIIYEGRVCARDEVKGRSTTHYLILEKTDDYGLELRIEVSRRIYEHYDVGDNFRQVMQRGGLGIDYRLRW